MIQKATGPRMAPLRIVVSTGRDTFVRVPFDMNAQEAIDLIAYISNELPRTLAEGRDKPDLIIARVPPGRA